MEGPGDSTPPYPTPPHRTSPLYPYPWPQTLKRKAEERNPDEFYFAMENAKTKDGVHDGRCANRSGLH